MILTKKQEKEFEKLVKPIAKYINELNPYVEIIIKDGRAEIVEELYSCCPEDYIDGK